MTLLTYLTHYPSLIITHHQPSIHSFHLFIHPSIHPASQPANQPSNHLTIIPIIFHHTFLLPSYFLQSSHPSVLSLPHDFRSPARIARIARQRQPAANGTLLMSFATYVRISYIVSSRLAYLPPTLRLGPTYTLSLVLFSHHITHSSLPSLPFSTCNYSSSLEIL